MFNLISIDTHHVPVVWKILLLYQGKPLLTQLTLDISKVGIDPGFVLEISTVNLWNIILFEFIEHMMEEAKRNLKVVHRCKTV